MIYLKDAKGGMAGGKTYTNQYGLLVTMKSCFPASLSLCRKDGSLGLVRRYWSIGQ